MTDFCWCVSSWVSKQISVKSWTVRWCLMWPKHSLNSCAVFQSHECLSESIFHGRSLFLFTVQRTLTVLSSYLWNRCVCDVRQVYFGEGAAVPACDLSQTLFLSGSTLFWACGLDLIHSALCVRFRIDRDIHLPGCASIDLTILGNKSVEISSECVCVWSVMLIFSNAVMKMTVTLKEWSGASVMRQYWCCVSCRDGTDIWNPDVTGLKAFREYGCGPEFLTGLISSTFAGERRTAEERTESREIVTGVDVQLCLIDSFFKTH